MFKDSQIFIFVLRMYYEAIWFLSSRRSPIRLSRVLASLCTAHTACYHSHTFGDFLRRAYKVQIALNFSRVEMAKFLRVLSPCTSITVFTIIRNEISKKSKVKLLWKASSECYGPISKSRFSPSLRLPRRTPDHSRELSLGYLGKQSPLLQRRATTNYCEFTVMANVYVPETRI